MVMRKGKSNLRTGAREPRAGPGRCRPCSPRLPLPWTSPARRPPEAGPVGHRCGSLPLSSWGGEGGLDLLQGCSGPLVPGRPLCFTASWSLSHGSWTEGFWSKLLRAQITGLASRPSNLFPTQGTKPRPALSLEDLSRLTPPASSHPRPGGLPAAAPGPLHWLLFQLPTFSLTHISLFLIDAHFQRRLPEGPVSGAPTTNDCRFAGAGMGGRCCCS